MLKVLHFADFTYINGYRIFLTCTSFLFLEDSFEFSIISLENKTWHFEANNAEERDSWITAIEQQILSSLQNSDGDKKNETDAFKMHCIKNKVSGNDTCVDCGAPSECIFILLITAQLIICVYSTITYFYFRSRLGQP